VNRQLLVQTLRGTAPLLVWAAHFTLCYVLVGVQCSPALFDGAAPRRWLLLVVSAIAVGACALMLWRAARLVREESSLREWAAAGSALLALAGVAWTSVPILMLDGCA